MEASDSRGVRAPGPGEHRRGPPRWAVEVAGPALILAAVLVVLHDMAFGGRFTADVDLQGYFLPHYCHLGESLRAGTIPGWNPFSMAGVPFAGDPQSGWMYLPAMAVFGALPCDAAMPVFLVLEPVVAGLGLYWFLRVEGIARAPAGIGGLMLALAIAGSKMVVTLPFAGVLAWTTVLLACAARYLRAATWAARLGWAVAAALAWGALVGAHTSHGTALGTGALAAYLIVRLVGWVREDRVGTGEAAAMGALLVVALVGVNLAFLLPRLSYLPQTNIGALGYDRMQELGADIDVIKVTGFAWPLRFATTPGAYLGAVPLALSFAGWWLPGRRIVMAVFTTVAVVTWALASYPVVEVLAPIVREWPLGSLYEKGAFRFQHGVLLAIPVLGAVGVEAWIRTQRWAHRGLMLLPGMVVFGLLPLSVGVGPSRLVVFWAAGALGLALLAGVGLRWLMVPLLAVAVAIELSLTGLAGQHAEVEGRGERFEEGARRYLPYAEPHVDVGAYADTGAIAEALAARGPGRYLSLHRLGTGKPGGAYMRKWLPEADGLLHRQRGMLVPAEDIQGYNPAQPERYWLFVQGVNEDPVRYNQAMYWDPTPAMLDLLHVRWLIGPVDAPAGPDLEPVADEGDWRLYERPVPPRAQLFTSWSVVSPSAAQEAVVAGDFDSSSGLLLERDPGIAPSPGLEQEGGSVTYEAVGTQGARITVEAPAPGMLLVRIPYDAHWQAAVDGEEGEVLRADFLMQAVPVPAGHHTVELTYRDPAIGWGLAGSAASVLLLLGAAGALSRGRVRASRAGPA